MTKSSDIDPLARLWQSAPAPDTGQLVHDLRRLQAVHRWHHRILVLILCGTALLLLFGAVALRSVSLGIITGLWIAFVAGAVFYQRTRCKAVDALDLDTVSLLKRMIERAKRGLAQARRLYAGVPVAAAVGAVATRIFFPGLPFGGHAVHPWLAQVFTIASLVMLGVMVVAGLVLARARQRQLRELTQTLRSFEESL